MRRAAILRGSASAIRDGAACGPKPRAGKASAIGFALVALASSCIQRGYPLGTSGSVDIRVDIAGPLFAADQIDAKGKPVLPRQDPHETAVTLFMSESGQPAFGAYVEVRVDPPEALVLASDPTEKTPSCAPLNGAFRCTASNQGYARLQLSSESQWSGNAKLLVTWGGNTPTAQPITILPAGLPQDAANFTLLVGDVNQATQGVHVLAQNTSLQCVMGPLPDTLGSKWPAGRIRARQAYVTATPSPTEPTALANAPVNLEALSAEAEFSLMEDCSDHHPHLRVMLDATGQSPPFFLCFSDNGGTIRYAVTSGSKTVDPAPQVVVDPEPRLLRVRALKSQVEIGTAEIQLFVVEAFNADRDPVAIPVDLTSGDDTVLALSVATIQLSDNTAMPAVVAATPLAMGATELHVSPRLFNMPDCTSPTVTVVPVMTTPGSVNGCDSTTTIASAGDVTINFPMTSTAQQYSPPCVKIHPGGHVTFVGDFMDHPLAAGPDGDANNPIMLTNTGTTASFLFPDEGSFGFHSSFEPSVMLGAVFVAP